MAERTRSEKRQRRSDAREKRRSLAAKPFEELDEAADAEEREGPSRSPLRQAASTAVLGAVVAGVAGAAKALADRRGDEPAAEQDSDENPSESEDRPEGSAADEDGEQPESREEDEQQADGEDEQPQAAADVGDPKSEVQGADDEDQPQVEMQSEAGQDEEVTEDEPQEPDDGANGSGGTPKGASSDEVKEIVEEAKRELQELLGTEPEKVSGFHRSDGRWTVTLEVVTVRRIPDTTDVLSSYEVTFDDDRNLVSLSETGRYRRSQVEEG